MTLVLLLRELWSRKALLAIGVILAALAAIASVYHVSLSPPSLQRSSLDYASAQTQIFVDSESSSLGDLMNDFTPMNARANVYARFLTTPTALRLIGRKAGVPGDEIYAQGPYQLGQARYIQEPTAERRGQQLVGEKAPYRLRFDSDPELPIVTMYAEAPSPEQATKLAEASATALAEYVTRLQAEQGISERRRVAIRKLGSTPGAWVSEGASRKVALFVFLVVLVLWCGATIAARRLITGWRQAGEEPADAPAPQVTPIAPAEGAARRPKPAKPAKASADGHAFRTRPRKHADHQH